MQELKSVGTVDISKRTLKEKSIRAVLAFQHLIAMFGSTVLVPIVTALIYR